MIPFTVTQRGPKASITTESLFWFFVVTAGATMLGEYLYQAYVVPRMTELETDTQDFLNHL